MSSFLKHLTATLKVFDLIPEFVLVFKALFDNSIGANANYAIMGVLVLTAVHLYRTREF